MALLQQAASFGSRRLAAGRLFLMLKASTNRKLQGDLCAPHDCQRYQMAACMAQTLEISTNHRISLHLSGPRGTMKSVESNVKKFESNQADTKPPQPRWKGFAREVLKQVCVVYLVLKNPKSPLLAKMVAGLTVGYIFSPIQLIPSFIPVIGWIDDVLVVSAGLRILTQLTPAHIMADCKAKSIVMLAKLFREEADTQGEKPSVKAA